MTELDRLVGVTDYAIKEATELRSPLIQAVLDIDGMSSPKVRHFFNNIVRVVGNARYLEVGLWKGSTFISALYGNRYKYAVGIENFSQWNETSREECFKNLKNLLNAPNVNTELIEDGFESAIVKLDKKFNIYFYDGYHSTEMQEQALVMADKNLEDAFVLIVDDWNLEGVRRGTWTAINKLKYKVPRFWELYAHVVPTGDLQNWWNGLFVAVIEKEKKDA